MNALRVGGVCEWFMSNEIQGIVSSEAGQEQCCSRIQVTSATAVDARIQVPSPTAGDIDLKELDSATASRIRRVTFMLCFHVF